METFQEKLQTLEKQIRNDLPRLLQPIEGCWVSLKGYNNSLFKIVHRRAKEFLVDDYQGHKPRTYENKKFFEWFEIVGHDILLSDVLEWIAEQNKGLHLDIEYEVKDNLLKIIVMENIDDIYSDFSKTYTEYYIWDLSKLRLADQSEELKEFLYELTDKED